jgi:hypothetical protein
VCAENRVTVWPLWCHFQFFTANVDLPFAWLPCLIRCSPCLSSSKPSFFWCQQLQSLLCKRKHVHLESLWTLTTDLRLSLHRHNQTFFRSPSRHNSLSFLAQSSISGRDSICRVSKTESQIDLFGVFELTFPSLGFWGFWVLGHVKSGYLERHARKDSRMSESLHENNRGWLAQHGRRKYQVRRSSLKQAFCSLTLILLQKMTTTINTHVRVYMMTYDDDVLEMHAISRGWHMET